MDGMTPPADPFFINGPAVISFSGGRTSAYMLWRILQAHGGTLPDDVVVCFANTGREVEATLNFVQACGEHWAVPIHWLEYRRDEATGHVWAEEVNHNSASRDGEPFTQLLMAKQMTPNPVMRFCTGELKVGTILRWLAKQHGRKHNFAHVIGIRADEPTRVERMTDPDKAKKSYGTRNVLMPLSVAQVTKGDVMAFWSMQPFDLKTRGPWEGNCDGCFLKRKSFIKRLAVDSPESAEWWASKEQQVSNMGRRGARFRKDWKGGYRAIIDDARNNPALPIIWEGDDGMDHANICDVSCGA